MTRRPTSSSAIALISGVCLAATARAAAQADAEAPELAALRVGLAADSPGKRAWAAYDAARLGIAEAAPLLRAALARLEVPAGGAPIPAEQRALGRAVLDAAIQLRAGLDSELLRRAAEIDPAAAVVLASCDPVAAEPWLREQLQGATSDDEEWIAAGNLLVRSRAKGVAVLLLRPLEIRVQVAVGPPPRAFPCGFEPNDRHDHASLFVRDGFPPLTLYRLTTSAEPGDLVVAPGPTAVYARRTQVRPGHGAGAGGSARSVERAEVRVAWLAELAGPLPSPLAWRGTLRRTLPYESQDQVESGAREIRRALDAEFDALVERLCANGGLTPEEAIALAPPFRFEWLDQRPAGEPPLPAPFPARDG